MSLLDESTPGPLSHVEFDLVLDRLQAARAELTRLQIENERLFDENLYLRSNNNDLLYRNRELVNGRVRTSFSANPADNCVYIKLAINNLALVMARDPRLAIEGAFRQLAGHFDHFFKRLDKEAGVGET